MQSKQKKESNRRGFTLIEMLVTIAVLSLLMTVTTMSFRSGEKNELLRLSARRIGDALRQIETFAQSGSKEYTTAASFGIHIETTLPQKMLMFADMNTAGAGGELLIGRWDGTTTDGQGRKDVQIGDARTLDATGTGAIILDAISVAYAVNDAAAVNTSCAKDASGACIRDSSGDYISTVSSLDIAARPPGVRFVISGDADFPAHPAGITVRQVLFDVKDIKSGRHKSVTLSPLSGRVDVEY